MSHLRAPATRPDRREGGRHGRPGSRSLSPAGRSHASPLPPEARIRPQLLRTAVLPTVVAALCGAAAVVFVLRAASPEPTFTLWVVLLGTAALAIAAVAAAAVGAERTARTVLGRASALRRTTARGQAELRSVVDRLRRGEGPPPRRAPDTGPRGGDEFDLLTQELSRSQDAAVTAVVQASRLSSSVGNEQKVEVFVNLARRLQSLVHREIQLLDELENEVEDPELLKGLFHVDHLATRIRRHAENLAVLGGAISRRQWSNPVTMTEVLRSAIAEVEQYPRVKLVPPIDGTLRGHAVADVIHLLAELVENATLFSAPHTQVLLRVQHVTAGLAVEVEDRGLGMPSAEQEKMNALLTDPDQVNVAHLLQDGRIGLFVVSALARRHGIAVRLQSNIYGGVQAVLVLPQGLLGAASGGSAERRTPASAAPEREPAPLGTGREPAQAALGHEPAQVTAEQLPGHATPAHGPAHAAAGHGPAHMTAREPVPAAAEPVPPAREPAPIGLADEHARPALPAQREQERTAPGLAPLPVRGDRGDRPNPASARPGATRTPSPAYDVLGGAPASHGSGAPADGGEPPRATPVRGTMGRPQLPRRRSQEHLVPQLRDAPAPRPDADPALHDPGLMAAFQRGIGLAESAHPGAPAPEAADSGPHHPHDTTTKE
ncbi:sensor histidine kinase [Streptomyces genisteinicus]|uniref:histidine kinase n=1 Tax=Streptomyces genisteinicus TaxID=2768068 RepID=A0A7H0I115_9ACTN|nr:ATP-binding protein [Streptomyces genisteinicus]QNP66481.1 ATP-binding protein [Streptomyces genisteinicus]